MRLRRTLSALAVLLAPLLAAPTAQAREIRIDFATYNPLSLILKDQKILETAAAKEGHTVRWVQSAGSNKAIEFLNAGSLDFGSTAGAAALLARINAVPLKTVYVYSQPEWTALVTRPDTGIASVADLKGKRIAVTRGTDPHIFLIRALAGAGLSEKDVKLVLLQHADGRAALVSKQVDAWSGLDPLMAAAEIDDGATLFFRNAAANTWGVLNARDEVVAKEPELVRLVVAAYEEAYRWARANPAELRAALAKTARLSDAVAIRQLERTNLEDRGVGAKQRESILAAGIALQAAGVLPADTDVAKAVDALLDPSFTAQIATGTAVR